MPRAGPPARWASRPTTVLGTGASQSAMYLVTYVNAIDPTGPGLRRLPAPRPRRPRGLGGGRLLDPRRLVTDLVRNSRPALPGHRIRSDARVPVMIVQSETDIVLLERIARQPDSDRLRLGEIAGTSHFDSYGTRVAFHDDGSLPPDRSCGTDATDVQPHGFLPPHRSTAGPQFHDVLQTAFEALRRWIVDGTPPASAPGWRPGVSSRFG